jgi:diacylglycerol kinase (ATP)
MTKLKPEAKKRFSIVARAKSFAHAGRGIKVFVASTHNAWIHIAVSVLVIVLGVYLGITRPDWILLIFAMGFVLVSEAFNTALEIDIDLTSPEYHPYAKDVKDVAAGAVLISAMTAALVGLLVFAPKVLEIIK